METKGEEKWRQEKKKKSPKWNADVNNVICFWMCCFFFFFSFRFSTDWLGDASFSV